MNSSGASLHLGATVREDGILFRVWAPSRRTVDVVVDGRRPVTMTRQSDGTFEALAPGLTAGARYQYRLDGELHRPDPASRYQPDGVHGPSVAVEAGSFTWTDQGFRGRDLADYVLYELHIGTFSRTGTFEAVIPHLPQLVDLGITAVELMPVAEFPGSRNWGYDGVHLFAPQSTYGGPRGLRRLVDACHAQGLSCPRRRITTPRPEGNYLGDFGPFARIATAHRGGSAEFDGPESAGVRRHHRERPGLGPRVSRRRASAGCHSSIFDASPRHILSELRKRPARRRGRWTGRSTSWPSLTTTIAGSSCPRRRWSRARRRWSMIFTMPSRPADRRARRLLLRLHGRPACAGARRGLCLPGRAVRILRPQAGHAVSRSARRALRDLCPEP